MTAVIRQFPFMVALILPALASATISFNSTIIFPAKDSSSENFIYSGVIDTEILSISRSCAEAYARVVPCNKWLIQSMDHDNDHSYSENDVYNKATLTTLCTDECIAGLEEWRDNIRSNCSTEDVANANAAASNNGDMASALISYVVNTTMLAVEFLYYPMCLKDLHTGAFCSAEADTANKVYFDSTDDLNATDIAEWCNSSCLTQTATFYWTAYASVMGTDDINIGNLTNLCPDVDINAFPFLKSVLSSSTSSPRSSGSPKHRRAGGGSSSSASSSSGASSRGSSGSSSSSSSSSGAGSRGSSGSSGSSSSTSGSSGAGSRGSSGSSSSSNAGSRGAANYLGSSGSAGDDGSDSVGDDGDDGSSNSSGGYGSSGSGGDYVNSTYISSTGILFNRITLTGSASSINSVIGAGSFWVMAGGAFAAVFGMDALNLFSSDGL
ncbi:hypothetical protein RUND412_002489, partial [Rhizina undulata]